MMNGTHDPPKLANAEAGPSSTREVASMKVATLLEGHMRIPSTGIEYYQYRRALFLAGIEPPIIPTPVPEYIIVPIPPLPIPAKPPMEVPPKLAKLDQVLSKKGSIRDSRVKDRVERMVDELRRGRVLGRGITLSLMIKIYKYEWTLDGLWPVDPITREPAIPPDSPIASTPDLPLYTNTNTIEQSNR